MSAKKKQVVDRKLRRVAEEEASKLGASVSFEHLTRHAALVVTLNGLSRSITIARSSRKLDHQLDWCRQNIRKLVKEIQCDTQKPCRP